MAAGLMTDARRCVSVFTFCILFIATQANQTYFDVYLKVQPVDDFCGARQCNITYSISVLSAGIGSVFGSEPLLLLDGNMVRRLDKTHNKYFFEDNSVVPLYEGMQKADKERQLYLGIRFFELPEDIQEYIVVDVTDVALHNDRRVRMEFSTETVRIQVHVYKRHEEHFPDESDKKAESPESAQVDNSTPKSSSLSECACAAKECGCCEHVHMKVIHLNDTACINVTYVSEDLGLRLTLEVDSHVYYSKELSVLRNPPPVCFEVPHLRDFASLCLRLYNVVVTEESISGCTKLEAVLYHLKVATAKLGCFKIPV
uniref:DUF4773 domain-containing protein n=1 Tax=Ditylenchus dipsaci TaxID=166011 RepID=A0A915CVF1_9BILA